MNNPYSGNDRAEAVGEEGGEDMPGNDLIECENCNRKFNMKAHGKHVLVCAKVNAKRKTFDSAKMRVEGNPELIQIMVKNNREEMKRKAQEARKGGGKPGGGAGTGGQNGMGGLGGGGGGQNAPVKRQESGGETGAGAGGGGGIGSAESAAAAKKSKWLAESEAFRASMRAARQVTQAIASGAPLPPPIASAPDPSLVQCPHCSRRCVWCESVVVCSCVCECVLALVCVCVCVCIYLSEFMCRLMCAR